MSSPTEHLAKAREHCQYGDCPGESDPPGWCCQAIAQALADEREACALKCDRLSLAWHRGGDKLKAAGAYQAGIEIRKGDA